MEGTESKDGKKIICPHCGKIIEDAAVMKGFSVICPHCKRPI